MQPDTRRNCRDCAHYRRTEQGPRCRFRGGKPSGICAVFSRRERSAGSAARPSAKPLLR